MNGLRQHANAFDRLNRKAPGYIYIYQRSLGNAHFVYLFYLEMWQGGGLELVRKIYVNEAGNFYKFLVRRFKARQIGEVFHLTPADLKWIASIDELKELSPDAILPEPSTLPIPERQTDRSGYVYVLHSYDNLFKIGRARHPDNRLRTFSVKLPFPVEYICLIKCRDMYKLEKDLHHSYAHKRVNGEWFRLDDEDIQALKKLEEDNKLKTKQMELFDIDALG